MGIDEYINPRISKRTRNAQYSEDRTYTLKALVNHQARVRRKGTGCNTPGIPGLVRKYLHLLSPEDRTQELEELIELANAWLDKRAERSNILRAAYAKLDLPELEMNTLMFLCDMAIEDDIRVLITYRKLGNLLGVSYVTAGRLLRRLSAKALVDLEIGTPCGPGTPKHRRKGTIVILKGTPPKEESPIKRLTLQEMVEIAHDSGDGVHEAQTLFPRRGTTLRPGHCDSRNSIASISDPTSEGPERPQSCYDGLRLWYLLHILNQELGERTCQIMRLLSQGGGAYASDAVQSQSADSSTPTEPRTVQAASRIFPIGYSG